MTDPGLSWSLVTRLAAAETLMANERSRLFSDPILPGRTGKLSVDVDRCAELIHLFGQLRVFLGELSCG